MQLLAKWLTAVIVLMTSGSALALTCRLVPPPHPDQNTPIYPEAGRIISTIGEPDHEDFFVAYGRLIPTHTQPLLHEEVLKLMQSRRNNENSDDFENSDIGVLFNYLHHFGFEGKMFDGQVWKDVQMDRVFVTLGISGENLYAGRLPDSK